MFAFYYLILIALFDTNGEYIEPQEALYIYR